jgi:hypothetical protein
MTRPMVKLGIVRRLRQEAKSVLKLSPLLVVAFLLVALLWRSDSAALSGLFQSSPPPGPSTPTVTSSIPTRALTPTTAPTQPAMTETPTQPVPGETPTQPVPGETPTQPAPGETPTLAATETVSPIEPTPTFTGTVTVMPTETTATVTPESSPTAEATVEPTPDDQQRYADEDSNLKFEWSMLFDSVSLFLSYLWLCCGVLIFLAIPVVFIALWVAGKRRQPPEE